MAYLKTAIATTLGVYFKVIYRLQYFTNAMIHSCKISTEKRIAQSVCNSRAFFFSRHNPQNINGVCI